jgi:phosphatidylglycerol:prolipoprotein diacylglycerol transferase
MRQVLFHIPILNLPIFGFGVMLIVAFVVSAWVAGRRAKAEGYKPSIPWDVGLYILVAGVIGARILSLLVDDPRPVDFWQGVKQFARVWEGGLVLYGSIPGGLIGYWLAYKYIVKPNGLRTLQVGDWLAPSIAMGIGFGRIGCFLNGCCYGDVADPAQFSPALAVQFPANSNPYNEVVWLRGWQTTYGFMLDDGGGNSRMVRAVDPGSSAAQAGLRPGDEIVAVNDQAVPTREELFRKLVAVKPYDALELTVRRAGKDVKLNFVPPPSLPLIPTQLYMSFDGFLLFGLLWTYYPFRRREGAVMALLMMTYAINRYLIERLRMDNPEFVGPLTISQAISIGLFAAGFIMMILVQWKGKPVSI